jgi:hypothetical protein
VERAACRTATHRDAPRQDQRKFLEVAPRGTAETGKFLEVARILTTARRVDICEA